MGGGSGLRHPGRRRNAGCLHAACYLAEIHPLLIARTLAGAVAVACAESGQGPGNLGRLWSLPPQDVIRSLPERA